MVVLPSGKDGHPLPASQTESYYHPKEGLFTDAEGNQVGFSGSVNESATALEDNYESFMVFNSWDSSPAHLKQIKIKFDKLWEGREKDWIAVPVPEAVKLELLKYRTSKPPVRDVGEPKPEDERPPIKPHIDAAKKEQIVFQFLRDAPTSGMRPPPELPPAGSDDQHRPALAPPDPGRRCHRRAVPALVHAVR